MSNYFEKLNLFNDEKKAPLRKCNCDKKQKQVAKKTLRIDNKIFYRIKTFAPLGIQLSPIWEIVINGMKEMWNNKYVPAENPLIVMRKGLFITDVYIQLLDVQFKPNSPKIRKIDCSYIVSQIYSSEIPNRQSTLKLIRKILIMSLDDRRRVLKKCIKRDIYFTLLCCPLCFDERPIASVLLI